MINESTFQLLKCRAKFDLKSSYHNHNISIYTIHTLHTIHHNTISHLFIRLTKPSVGLSEKIELGIDDSIIETN